MEYRSFRSATIHGVLEAAAADDPNARAVSFVGGAAFSRSELLAQARTVAGGLRRAGVRPGDRVVMILGNRPEFLTTYLAVSMLGAVSVPLNTALRGDVLTYMLEAVGPATLVFESGLAADVVPSVAAAGGMQRLWCVPTGSVPTPDGAVRFEELLPGPALDADHPSQPWDLASILFTSGTTGRSKGVMWSHKMAGWFADNATWVMGYDAEDVVYTCLPLFHINALFTAFLAGLQEGASIVVSARFNAAGYWKEVGESGATVTNMLGAMSAILWKQQRSPAEQAHRLRLAMLVPFPNDYHEEFEGRFGCRITELYGSTDTGIPLGVPHGERHPGSCGVPAPGWQAALVDEHDEPVAADVSGELVTRPLEPFVGQLGYWRQPDNTWEAHRNCWFHTGDLLAQDADGWFHFVDRVKDAMRVSGENVSAFEVEQVLLAHPRVAEAAVYAVPSEMGEDDIMAAVVVEGPEPLEPAELIEFVAPRLAYFAVPRFVEILSELPKTSTEKVRKGALRARGRSASTWDSGRRRRGSR
ncbi:AMP-binding protein [Pseudonocardia adelaidensis]|uniref:ATP-dependent acyl-CoA ligase n=1 Tax=Pseudonocardia adelaidensis TaxID=648754 RepID=A0ABP9NMZ0_9PSEU